MLLLVSHRIMSASTPKNRGENRAVVKRLRGLQNLWGNYSTPKYARLFRAHTRMHTETMFPAQETSVFSAEQNIVSYARKRGFGVLLQRKSAYVSMPNNSLKDVSEYEYGNVFVLGMRRRMMQRFASVQRIYLLLSEFGFLLAWRQSCHLSLGSKGPPSLKSPWFHRLLWVPFGLVHLQRSIEKLIFGLQDHGGVYLAASIF